MYASVLGNFWNFSRLIWNPTIHYLLFCKLNNIFTSLVKAVEVLDEEQFMYYCSVHPAVDDHQWLTKQFGIHLTVLFCTAQVTHCFPRGKDQQAKLSDLFLFLSLPACCFCIAVWREGGAEVVAPPWRPRATQGERREEELLLPLLLESCAQYITEKISTVRFSSPRYFQGTLLINLHYIGGCHINESVCMAQKSNFWSPSSAFTQAWSCSSCFHLEKRNSYRWLTGSGGQNEPENHLHLA